MSRKLPKEPINSASFTHETSSFASIYVPTLASFQIFEGTVSQDRLISYCNILKSFQLDVGSCQPIGSKEGLFFEYINSFGTYLGLDMYLLSTRA